MENILSCQTDFILTLKAFSVPVDSVIYYELGKYVYCR